jgi:hypothetical protein
MLSAFLLRREDDVPVSGGEVGIGPMDVLVVDGAPAECGLKRRASGRRACSGAGAQRYFGHLPPFGLSQFTHSLAAIAAAADGAHCARRVRRPT